MVRTTRLTSAHERDALAYLALAPYANVFLTYLILFDLGSTTRSALHVALDESGKITGVAYFARQVVLAADGQATVEAFARVGAAHHGEKMIVGPRREVSAYWRLVRHNHEPARLVRERQHVMMLDRSMLRPYEHTVVARRARLDEWPIVADNSASMIALELDYDPMRTSPEFTSNVRTMIDRGLWWVGESLGRLCFFCNVGPWSPMTAQLQGIWTPPELRGRGLATAALGAVCDRLLELTPSLSLYVNDFNEKAIALYERAGFVTVGEFQTILF
ncbi:MAG TPA: GNAT family N-acetyltransferase [Candidatus Baltobacteraceae bacterium]|nr:GNAT family N-acetyltransferase [Candidatus Baltobacteraceae bacterium]